MQHQLCEHCMKKSFSRELGLTCELTGQKPNYSGHCSTYEEDPQLVKIYEREAQHRIEMEQRTAEDDGTVYGISIPRVVGLILGALGVVGGFVTFAGFANYLFASIAVFLLGFLSFMRGRAQEQQEKTRKSNTLDDELFGE